MRKYEYSNELANLVKKFLDEDDWSFSFNEDMGIFDFSLTIRRKIQKIDYIVDVHENEIVVYGMCPLGADHTDANMMAQMAEFCCRANYALENGCFELDYNDGEIRFRNFIDCAEMMPSIKVIKNSIYRIAAVYERYAPGIVDVIFCTCTAKEAIAKCENAKKDELRSLLTEAVGKDMETSEIEEMLVRLATRLGITEGIECTEDDFDGDIDSFSDEDIDSSSDEDPVNPSDGKQEGGEV